MTDFARERDEAVRLARAAGAILMTIYATDFAVSYKGHDDPVTDADKRANEFIVAGLRTAFPTRSAITSEHANQSAPATPSNGTLITVTA